MVDGDLDLNPGVRILATPGHTPATSRCWSTTATTGMLVTGDLIVHAMQLLHPDLAYDSDMDKARRPGQPPRHARQRAAARGSVLAVSHLGTAFR